MQIARAIGLQRADWGRALLLVAMLAVAALTVASAAQAADPTFPELTGRVVDGAGLLDVGQEAALTTSLASLENRSTDQVVVVTVPSLQGYTIEDYANRLFRHWQIGQKNKNNGILLVVAPNERKVRIEVGYGLEGTITDGLSSVIIQNRILPVFRRGDFPGGIVAGVKDIEDSLLGDPEEVKKRAKGAGRQNRGSWTDWLPLLFWVAIVLFIVWSNYRSMKQGLSTTGGRRRGGGVVIIPGGYGGSGSWGSGGGGGWSGGGGGGFGGGGGSSGGGGASGGW